MSVKVKVNIKMVPKGKQSTSQNSNTKNTSVNCPTFKETKTKPPTLKELLEQQEKARKQSALKQERNTAPTTHRSRKMMSQQLYRVRRSRYNGDRRCGIDGDYEDMDLMFYPHEVLKTPTQMVPLGFVKSEEFKQRISSMFQVMYRRGGIGLAAPQVGWNARVIVGNALGRAHHDSGAFILINPEIIPFGEEVEMVEGCLSIPGVYAAVRRPQSVMVRSLTFDGQEREIAFDGLISRIVQHEYDHLEGILFIDRLTFEERNRISPEIEAHTARIAQLRQEREEEAKKKEEEEKARKAEEKKKKEEKKKEKGNSKKNDSQQSIIASTVMNALSILYGQTTKVSQRDFDRLLRRTVKKQDGQNPEERCNESDNRSKIRS